MGQRRYLAALAGAIAATAACVTSFAGCSSDETVVAAPDDAAPEAQPALDAQVADTSVADASDASDARKEAGPPSGFCAGLNASATPPKFCDDFDDGDPANNWDFATASPATSVIDSDDDNVSAPLSLLTAVKAITAGNSATAQLRTTLLAAVSHPKLQFQARFGQTAFTGGSVGVATLNVSTNHLFALYLCDPDAIPACSPTLVEQAIVGGTSKVTRHLLTAVPPANTWTNVVIDLDFVAGKANVSFGATPALVDDPIAAQVGTEATIRIGAVYMFGPIPDFVARFDNVVLEY